MEVAKSDRVGQIDRTLANILSQRLFFVLSDVILNMRFIAFMTIFDFSLFLESVDFFHD